MASLVSRSGFDAARAAFVERLYRGRSVLVVGLGDGALCEVLLARGAARVAGVDLDEAAVNATRARLDGVPDETLALRTGPLREAAHLGGPFDVVFVRRGETMVARDLWRDAARQVRAGGWLVAAALAGDRPEAPRGAMAYAALRGHLQAYFAHVTVLAEAGFSGAALVPFVDGGGGTVDVDPVLDTALAAAPAPELYLAIAGPEPLALPYGLIELPPRALEVPAPGAGVDLGRLRAENDEQKARLATLDEARRTDDKAHQARLGALTRQLAERDAQLATLRAEVDALEDELEALHEGDDEESLRTRLVAAEAALEAMREAALLHAEEMRKAVAALSERDARLDEVEAELTTVAALREALRAAEERAAELERREREARRRVAELSGERLRLGAPPSEARGEPAPEAASVELAALRLQVAELQAQNARLVDKAAQSEREAWAQMKARSEAEAAAAEVREDTVRKLKDARKIANVELMRAMEEATRKAILLKEELVRSERERKEAVAALAALRAAAPSVPDATAPAEPGAAPPVPEATE